MLLIPFFYIANGKILRYLDRKGAFLVKKAGDRIAKFYDMSKYTMYSYLDQGRTADE